MKRLLYKKVMKPPALLFVLSVLLITAPTVLAAESPLVTSVDELTSALANAKDGDTILVGDITFKPMPMGMIAVPRRSGRNTHRHKLPSDD